jgi:hypothetical protein
MLVERMSRDSAAALGAGLSDQLVLELGPNGRGPLATSIGAAVAEASRSAVRGARGELEDMFAGCEGGDRDACVDAKVRSLGRAAAAGFVEGVVGSMAWAVVAVAFLVGVATSLVVGATLRGWQRSRPRPRPREVHP